MIDDTIRRSFDTPDVPGVDHVSIYQSDGDKLFRAVQFYHRDTFEDGTKWMDERENYVTSEQYRQAVTENTHIPVEDIRLESVPIATPHGVI